MSDTPITDIHIKPLKKKSTFPEILMEVATGRCFIKGESFPEDSWKFYEPILAWLRDYIAQKQGPIEFSFQLDYYNTSTSKCFFEILKTLRDYKEGGGKVVVNWYYQTEDMDALDDANDYVEYLKFPINKIAR